jgi:2',3'-cyclic-nucleotide 2'-phosphodiesterase (5'-nucleotidase family)
LILLDFGVETLTGLIKETNFPWLLSNVFDSVTNDSLAGSKVKLIVEFSGVKVSYISANSIPFI